jgi:hypothetical protein
VVVGAGEGFGGGRAIDRGGQCSAGGLGERAGRARTSVTVVAAWSILDGPGAEQRQPLCAGAGLEAAHRRGALRADGTCVFCAGRCGRGGVARGRLQPKACPCALS